MVTATAVEENLRTHILAPWFPRAIDHQHGGFHQNYAEDWTPLPDASRSLVYQSRLIWVASQAALRYPGEADMWRASVRHGVEYLERAFWDQEYGGWYWEVPLAGKPNTEKHAYGIAFGIYACASAFRATQDPQALILALSAFQWLETHAHDTQNDGFFEALTREGQPSLTASGNDAIGTRHGLKSMNTHIHLLEAFTALHEIVPEDPLVLARLSEVFTIVRDRITAPEGWLHLYLTPDWQSVPAHDSFGHDVETAYLLEEAAHALGQVEEVHTRAVSRRLMDHALRFGWDTTQGGFYDEGESEGAITNPRKVWWTQAEGLNALLLMDQLYRPETSRYADAIQQQWTFIERFLVDHENGGWRTDVAADGTPTAGQKKSDAWKDPYHQARALMNVADILKR